MQKPFHIHFAKGALPPCTPPERYFLDSKLGHQGGCCHQWRHDPAAPPAHGPCSLPPLPHWQLAYHGRQEGGGSRCLDPQPPVLQQHQKQQQQRRRQPQPPPPCPPRQRLCPVHGAQRGPPAAATALMALASAPQPLPAPITSLTSAPTTSLTCAPAGVPTVASSGPAPPSAAGTFLEPSKPTDVQPLPAPVACGPFASYNSGADPGLHGLRPWLYHLAACLGLLLLGPALLILTLGLPPPLPPPLPQLRGSKAAAGLSRAA